jgi:hypothetical protein
MREVVLYALIGIGLVAPVEDTTYVAPVSASYVIATGATTAEPVIQECCGNCVGGIVTHADGHTTLCPCPPTCKCKTKAAPPTKSISPKAMPCPDGKCKKP